MHVSARSYLEDLRAAAAGHGDDEDGELEGDEAAAAAAAGDAELAEKLRLAALEVCVAPAAVLLSLTHGPS